MASEEDPQVAALADFASVKFAISVGAVYRQFDPPWLVVAVLAQATWIVLLVNVLALSHLLLHFAGVVFLGSQLRYHRLDTLFLGRGLDWLNKCFRYVCEGNLMIWGKLKGNLQIRYFYRSRYKNRLLIHRHRHTHWRTHVLLGPLYKGFNRVLQLWFYQQNFI